jgi:DNA invertase Pin-like site-specific DNA recombinase
MKRAQGAMLVRIAIYPASALTTKARTRRTSCSNCGNGAPTPAIPSHMNTSIMGRKSAQGRKQFAQLFEDAHKRKFDCVLFWALDRFTREGMTPTIGYLQRLASCGVSFHSYTEAHLSTDNELVGNILLAVMSSLAKVESQKNGERTRAGMARARAQGKRIGRPALDPAIQRKIAKQLGAGLSAYAVAKQLGINAHTVAKYSPFAANTGGQ